MNRHRHDLGAASHSHEFGRADRSRRERALAWVVGLTLGTMAAELVAGWWFGSLALSADGWHMGTHALALGGALLAYRMSARAGRGYAFGGWKIEVLSAYTSGLALLAVAVWLAVDSVATLFTPRQVAWGEAMVVAVLGLAVNLASAWLMLRGAGGVGHAHAHAAHEHEHEHEHGHGHGHGHGHAHAHGHGHAAGADTPRPGGHDHNYRAALVHVAADALTSVLAIAALAGGAWFGAGWLDPAVALLGALLIGQWSLGVLRSSARALVDATHDAQLEQQVRRHIESDGDAQVADLHLWQVGDDAWSASIAVVADAPREAREYRARLAAVTRIRHAAVEVHRCPGVADATPGAPDHA